MNFTKLSTISILVLIIFTSCSGESKTPVTSDSSLPNVTEMLGAPSADINRDVLAVYDAVIDPEAKTFTVTPVQRVGTYHFPLSKYFPNVLQITGYGFTPNFWADIKLSHPYPGSGIDAFDPRVITILPANPGVSFNYPVFNCVGNNKVVLEPDGYTKLFDNLGGSIIGNTNPFKAYFKDQPYRVWSSTGVTQETQRWQMNLAGFGGPMQFKLVVDISTNYPNPPQAEIDNAPEPVKIDATVGPGLTTAGGSASITVTLLDWQGRMTIGGVLVEAPDLFYGTISLSYSTPGPNPNEYIYTGTISNDKLAPAGEYKFLVAAWDQATSIYLYNEFTAVVSYDFNLSWAKRAGGTYWDEGLGITTLSDNSTVMTGGFGYLGGDSATFGLGEINETVLTSAGSADIFIARYNPDGTLAWAKRAGGVSDDWGYGITILSDDSTVVSGVFSEIAIFGTNEHNEKVLWSAGGVDIFIAQYNPDGTLAWAKRAGGSSDDGGYGITTLSDDSTVVTGDFQGSATFGPGESNQTVLTGGGTFIARYNPDGTLAWAKSAGGFRGYGITMLSDNSIVVTGGGSDIFIERYNPDGTLVWAKNAGGASNDYGYGISTLSDNSTIVTGMFNGTATFGPGESNQTVLTSAGYYDIFIARYNPNGTLLWAKSAGGASNDNGNGITKLSDNSSVVTGKFYQSAVFGLGESNQTFLYSAGGDDIFIAQYNPNGTLAGAKSIGGSSSDEGYGITTLSDDSTVVTGYFSGNATFGPGGPNETVLTSAGHTDIFIARFEP